MEFSRILQTAGVIGILTFSLVALSACTPSSIIASSEDLDIPITVDTPNESTSSIEVDIAVVSEDRSTDLDSKSVEQSLALVSSGELSQGEIEGLLFMREEEKLAHDVYIELNNIWGLPIIQNISQSEQTHTEAVLTLINRYGLEDPAATTEVGEFTNAVLQDLYYQLVTQGSQSLIEALNVGVAIEEIDILDLQENIDNSSHADIIMVYENLMKGSRNHLRSFVSTVEKQGDEEYFPQYLSLEAYEEFIGSEMERGGSGNNGRGRNKNNSPSKGA